MVGEGEGGVALVAEDRCRIDGPAGDGGDAAGAEAAQPGRIVGLRRADHHMARDLLRGEGAIGGEDDAERFVDPRHLHGLRVEHEGEAGGAEALQQFLALAQRVAEQDRDLALVERRAAEMEDIVQHPVGRRKAVAGQAEGGLHDDDVGGRRGAGFRRLAGAELEIAGVEEGLPFPARPELGRAEDVAGGIEPDFGIGVEGERFPVVQHRLDPLPRHPRGHQARGALRADQGLVGGGVVRMGMGNEGAGHGKRRIEPEIDLGEEDSAPVEYLPAHPSL